MTEMFLGCRKLTSLDVRYFDTKRVINMQSMFSRCSSLSSLELGNFDTSNVKKMSEMFEGLSIALLDLSNQQMWKICLICSLK